MNKEVVLQEASLVLDDILKEELSEEGKDRVINDSIDTIIEKLDETLAEAESCQKSS